MGKIKDPIRFSTFFNIPEQKLASLGVLDPTLNADTKLFIDPLLLSKSAHPEISAGARKSYVEHFEKVIKLLRASRDVDDVAWRAARRLMAFPEIKWTGLGYGASSVSGAGSGAFTTQNIMKTAKEVVDLGIDDPDLFVALGVFEEGIGPDRISDMTANVIFGDLLAFNHRILLELDVPTEDVTIRLRNGMSFSARLPINPALGPHEPVILVPTDILRALPVAKDWSDVSSAAAQNQELRSRVNLDLGNIWETRTLRDKDELRARALGSPEAFETLLDLLHRASGAPYDVARDPLGEVFWRGVADTIADTAPLQILAPKKLDQMALLRSSKPSSISSSS